jgi:predicted acyltransferase
MKRGQLESRSCLQAGEAMVMPKSKSSRLRSLDVFRGVAIAGMLLVNKAGLPEEIYPWLAHADWNGCTVADLVFPFFLFAVGAAMAFSFAKYTADHQPTQAVYGRILRRGVVLFAIGLMLNGFWSYDWSTIRWMGILQRISLAYVATALIVLKLPRKAQWGITASLLLGYWVALAVIPVPEYGAGELTRVGNFGAYFDRLVIPTAHLYAADQFENMGDPEGLFSTLPAIATVLLGYFTGVWLRTTAVLKEMRTSSQSITMAIFGLSSLVVGQVWSIWFPINKKLWSSSYVLFTVGLALLLFAVCFEMIEVRGKEKWGRPLEILGLNSIFVFVASVLVIKLLAKTTIGAGEQAPSTYTWLYENIFLTGLAPATAGFLFAAVTLLFWWLVAYGLHWRRWYLTV